MRQAIGGVGQHRHSELLRGHAGRARDDAGEAAAVADVVPRAGGAGDQTEPVPARRAVVLAAPLTAAHLAAAGGAEHALSRVWREAGVEARQVGGGADEAGGRGQRVRAHADVDGDSFAERVFGAVGCSELRTRRKRPRIGRGLFQAGGSHDLARDPIDIRLAGDLLDHQAKQPIAVVRILEARVGGERRRLREAFAQRLLVEKGSLQRPLPGIDTVAYQARAVARKLCQRQ